MILTISVRIERTNKSLKYNLTKFNNSISINVTPTDEHILIKSINFTNPPLKIIPLQIQPQVPSLSFLNDGKEVLSSVALSSVVLT